MQIVANVKSMSVYEAIQKSILMSFDAT